MVAFVTLITGQSDHKLKVEKVLNTVHHLAQCKVSMIHLLLLLTFC